MIQSAVLWEECNKMIEKGLQAPNFCLQDQNGQRIELNSLRGTKVCILFFSSIVNLDNQAFLISYAKMMDYFIAFDVHIIAICNDSTEALRSEGKRLHIPFSILSDTDQRIKMLYDVWKQKITFGKPRWVTARSALLINEDGFIYKTYKRAGTETNVTAVLQLLKHDYEKAQWRKLSRRTKERIKKEQAMHSDIMVSDCEVGIRNDDLIEFIEAFQTTTDKKTE